MKHEKFDPAEPGLRGPEWRAAKLLRKSHDPDGLRADLLPILGSARTGYCIGGMTELLILLRRHSWHMPLFLRPGATSVSEDERSLARFILLCAEQQRDEAMAEAMMMVTPQAIVPLVSAGERMGLPLLCEDCRKRLRCPLTFQ